MISLYSTITCIQFEEALQFQRLYREYDSWHKACDIQSGSTTYMIIYYTTIFSQEVLYTDHVIIFTALQRIAAHSRFLNKPTGSN